MCFVVESMKIWVNLTIVVCILHYFIIAAQNPEACYECIREKAETMSK